MTAHLNDDKIDVIVRVIDGWTENLSWPALVEAIAIRLGESPSRQALSRHPRILKAFQLKKKLLQHGRPELKLGRAEVEKLHEQIGRLKSENLRLTAENNELLDQFRRWAYNASISGLSKADLNRPLPRVDRRDPK